MAPVDVAARLAARKNCRSEDEVLRSPQIVAIGSARGGGTSATWLKHLENRSGHPPPERSDGDLQLHMALAGAEGRTPPQLKQPMAKSHSFAVTGPGNCPHPTQYVVHTGKSASLITVRTRHRCRAPASSAASIRLPSRPKRLERHRRGRAHDARAGLRRR